MPKPRDACRQKKRYATERAARSAACDTAGYNQRPMYTYPCAFCLGHHLTSKQPDTWLRTQEQARNRKRARVPVGEYV